MRHRKKGKILDRKVGPRKALIKNLATSLIIYEKIKTTEAKAKVLRSFVERLITKGKVNNLQSRREILRRLFSENAVRKILDELGPRYKDRAGGYTRIIKIGKRKGDGGEIAQVELV